MTADYIVASRDWPITDEQIRALRDEMNLVERRLALLKEPHRTVRLVLGGGAAMTSVHIPQVDLSITDLLIQSAALGADLVLWEKHTPGARAAIVAWAAVCNHELTVTRVGDLMPYDVYLVEPSGASKPGMRVYVRVGK